MSAYRAITLVGGERIEFDMNSKLFNGVTHDAVEAIGGLMMESSYAWNERPDDTKIVKAGTVVNVRMPNGRIVKVEFLNVKVIAAGRCRIADVVQVAEVLKKSKVKRLTLKVRGKVACSVLQGDKGHDINVLTKVRKDYIQPISFVEGVFHTVDLPDGVLDEITVAIKKTVYHCVYSEFSGKYFVTSVNGRKTLGPVKSFDGDYFTAIIKDSFWFYVVVHGREVQIIK